MKNIVFLNVSKVMTGFSILFVAFAYYNHERESVLPCLIATAVWIVNIFLWNHIVERDKLTSENDHEDTRSNR
jgi:hypothetical protein